MKALKPIALAILLAANPAFANDERQSLELLRNTTMSLIEALVESGVLTREKADGLIKDAERKAARAAKTAKADTAVRVPYVPAATLEQVRESVKQEVIAQAKTEGWATQNAIPQWLDRVTLYGDVRVRYQGEAPADDNTAGALYDVSNLRLPELVTRNATLADTGRTATSTVDDANSFRVRARLGAAIRLSESTSADIRIVTGSSGSAVSTNQTQENGFRKYDIWLDRAAIRYEPAKWVQFNAGRIANPWMTSDLMWDDDVNFDGATVTFKGLPEHRFVPFATFGAFPLYRESKPKVPDARNLFGGQIGFNWEASSTLRVRAAIAQYDFDGMEGKREPSSAFDELTGVALTADYGSSEYPSSMRAKGNTLFRVNAVNDQTTTTKWGLASRFRPLHVSAGVDFADFEPVHIVLAADYVKNQAFDRDEIFNRTGIALTDGKDSGYQIKLMAGMPSVRMFGDWMVEVGYRRLGSDAVLDGLTDSDFGLGGTNHRGFTLGGAFGIDERTSIGLRYLSARSLESPTLVPGDKYDVDVFQADLNVRF